MSSAMKITVTDQEGAEYTLKGDAWEVTEHHLIVKRDNQVVARFAPGWRSVYDERATAE